MFEGFGEGVVAGGLEIGRDEKLAAAGGFTRSENLGGVSGIAEGPLEGDGVSEFLREQGVAAGAADGGVGDAP